jgi:acetyl/propionyl-CoA carboxylase alpha subunit
MGPVPLCPRSSSPHALAQTYAAEATIEAVRQATVAAQVQGRVLETRVDAGARVRQGDVLMRIDTREADQAWLRPVPTWQRRGHGWRMRGWPWSGRAA